MKKYIKLSVFSVKKFIIIYYIVGLIGLSIPYSRNLFIYIIPFAILINLFFILYFNKNWGFKFVIYSISLCILGFIAELIGVNTGLIFGNYTYNNSVLGIKIMNTPLIIGFNWFILIYCTFILINKLKYPVIIRILIGGLIMLIFDLILEPVAIKLSMWNWITDKTPLQNYVAWFLLSCGFIGLLYTARTDIKNVISIHFLLVQFIFFLGLNLLL